VRSVVAAVIVAVGASGCQSFSRDPRDPKVPSSLETMKTAVDEGSDAELLLEAEFNPKDAFLLHPATASEPLPNIRLNGVSITESGLYDAVQLIAKMAGLGLSIEGGAKGMERYGATASIGLSGNLPEVMENLSNAMGFFYTVNGGVLNISPEQQFVIEMPPSLHEDNLSGISNTLQYLGARDVYLDRLNRSLTFRGNKKTVAGVEAYLQRVRTTRSLLVYDVHVFQVDLSDNTESGVQWDRFSWRPSGTGASTAGGTGTTNALATATTTTADSVASVATRSASLARSGGFGVGATFSGANFNLSLLVNFLRTQGTVKNISQPRMALLTGSKGSLRVGQATTYVSKVGTNVSANLNQVTVETKDLQTGFELTLFGEEHDGTVYTRVQMTLSDLVKFNKFTALGTDLTLPQTADREVRTAVRARPGDTILLGGINVSRDALDVSNGITANAKTGAASRSELVIALRPKLVRFVSSKMAEAPSAAPGARMSQPGRASDETTSAQAPRPYSIVEPREPMSGWSVNGQTAGWAQDSPPGGVQ
jgi:hypothetical protein